MAKKPSMQAARVRLGKFRSLDMTAMLTVVGINVDQIDGEASDCFSFWNYCDGSWIPYVSQL